MPLNNLLEHNNIMQTTFQINQKLTNTGYMLMKMRYVSIVLQQGNLCFFLYHHLLYCTLTIRKLLRSLHRY